MTKNTDPEIDFDDFGQGWVKKDADHSKCLASSCMSEAVSFGRGELDTHGFWEFGCYHCARAWEQNQPEYDEAWPFSNNVIEKQA